MRNRLYNGIAGVIRALRAYPTTWLEIDDNGLRIKSQRWPLSPWKRFLRWGDVKEIHAVMRDCYTMHVLGLDFLKFDGGWFRVDETEKGWDDLVASLPGRFPGFDSQSYRQIEGLAPRQGRARRWGQSLISD